MNGPDLSKYRRILEQRKGQYKLIKNQIKRTKFTIKQEKKELLEFEQAQALIQEVAQDTQNALKYQISELVTLALESVLDKPYEFAAEFIQKRNQTECELSLLDNGKVLKPVDDNGGGVVDIVALALRISLWSLHTKTIPVIILDEPFHFLKGNDMPEKGAQFIQEISHKLGIQIILTSHITDQIEHADSIHHFTKKKGVTQIERLRND